MLDTKYKETNLDRLVSESENINTDQHNAISCLLGKYEDLIDGTLEILMLNLFR